MCKCMQDNLALLAVFGKKPADYFFETFSI